MKLRFLGAWCVRSAWISLFVTSACLTADTLYVCNQGLGTISVVDVDTGDIVASMISPDPLTLFPDYIAATPDETKACVLFEGSNQAAVLDLTANMIKKTLSMQAVVDARTPAVSPLAVTPDGTKAYVVHRTDCSVSVIDMASGMEVGFFSVGTKGTDHANSVSFSPDGKVAYVTRSSEEDGAVVAFGTDMNEIIGTIPLQGFPNPGPIAIAPNGLKAYVGEASDVVLVVDLQSSGVVGRIDQGCEPCFITFDSSGGTAYVVLSSGVTQLVDAVHDVNSGRIATASANQVVFSSDGKRLFANNQVDSWISVIDVAKGAVTGTWVGFSYPLGLVLTSANSSSRYAPSAPAACWAKTKKVSRRTNQLILSWSQSPSLRVVRYDIYFGRDKVGSVAAASKHSFSIRMKSPHKKHKHRSKRPSRQLVKKYKYSVRAVTASGLESQSISPK